MITADRLRDLEKDPLRALDNELPPSLQPKSTTGTDRRNEMIGVQEAADLLGLGRTQVWRYATEGHSRLGILPHEIFGTTKRAEYKFKREHVLAFKARLEEMRRLEAAQKAITRRRKSDRHLREALWMIQNGEIDLDRLMQISQPGKPGRKPGL